MVSSSAAWSLLVAAAGCVGAAADPAASGLAAEVYANSVMRGVPTCTKTVGNGFSLDVASLCGPAHAAVSLVAGQYSIRLTGTLTTSAAAAKWYAFTSKVGPTSMVRLWIDDHRLVDAWDPNRHGHQPPTDTPTTPGLMPNVTISSTRPVFVRVDLRPMNSTSPIEFTLNWSDEPGGALTPVPDSALSPAVSPVQQKRRHQQERASKGWNHWQRKSQVSIQSLPHQFGVALSVQNASGWRYANALPEARSRQVKMGAHAFDGECSTPPPPVSPPSPSPRPALPWPASAAKSATSAAPRRSQNRAWKN